MKKKLKDNFLLLLLAVFIMSGCNNGEEIQPDSEKVLNHLVFTEISYMGSWHAGWNGLYPYDQYIKITNPTDHDLYLDGMALACSGLSTGQLVDLNQGTDFRATHFGAGILIRFPGKSGEMKYAIRPGESVFIAKVAHNHTVGNQEEDLFNKDSYNLSNVNFEWASVNQLQNEGEFFDNPGVENMRTIYPIEKPEDAFPQNLIPEYGVLALIRIPAEVSDTEMLSNTLYKWATGWTTSNKTEGGVDKEGGGHLTDGDYNPVVFLKIPNEWVIDAVQICPQQDYQWSVVGESVEKGSCSVLTSKMDKIKNPQKIAGMALHRRFDGKKFVDTNNSDVDFEVRPSSLGKKAL